MQFNGQECRGTFWGEAEISGEVYGMFRCSGEMADEAVRSIIDNGLDCYASRFDAQITVSCPGDYEAANLSRELKKHEIRGVTLIEGGDDLDTVYIGSRSSDTYIRLYEKSSPEGKLLRFEVEFKKARAKAVWEALKETELSLLCRQVLINEVNRISGRGYMSRVRKIFVDVLGDYTGNRIKVSRRSKTSTELWLDDVIAPLIIRMLASHESGEREFSRSWVSALNNIMITGDKNEQDTE